MPAKPYSLRDNSACEWLYEKGYEVIIKNKKPARALGFLTGFHKELQKRNIQINIEQTPIKF